MPGSVRKNAIFTGAGDAPPGLAKRRLNPHTVPRLADRARLGWGEQMLRFGRTFSVTSLVAPLAVAALMVSSGAEAQSPSGMSAAPPAATAAPAPAPASNTAPPAAAAANTAAPAASAAPRFLIYFNEFSAYLSPRAKVIIADAAKKAKATGATSITVQARASATGTPQTNKYLAMTRASIVADELEADGIEPAMVQQQPIGQTGSSDPSVFNRRVDIVLHR